MTPVVTCGTPRLVSDDVAKRLEAKMKELGMSERELARIAQLKSDTHIGLILDRGGARTGGSTLARIAHALGVSADWLITGSDFVPNDLVIDRDVRYPNLLKAIELLGVAHRSAVTRSLRRVFAGAETKSVEWWVLQIRALEEEERRRLEDPEAFAMEEQRGREEAAAAPALAAAESQRKVAAIKGRRKSES